jgi:hypothetical protein
MTLQHYVEFQLANRPSSQCSGHADAAIWCPSIDSCQMQLGVLRGPHLSRGELVVAVLPRRTTIPRSSSTWTGPTSGGRTASTWILVRACILHCCSTHLDGGAGHVRRFAATHAAVAPVPTRRRIAIGLELHPAWLGPAGPSVKSQESGRYAPSPGRQCQRRSVDVVDCLHVPTKVRPDAQ